MIRIRSQEFAEEEINDSSIVRLADAAPNLRTITIGYSESILYAAFAILSQQCPGIEELGITDLSDDLNLAQILHLILQQSLISIGFSSSSRSLTGNESRGLKQLFSEHGARIESIVLTFVSSMSSLGAAIVRNCP